MPPVRFEPTISAGERPKTYALDRAAAGINCCVTELLDFGNVLACLYVCVGVCMCLCVYVCMYVCVYACMCLCVCVFTYDGLFLNGPL